MVQWDNSKPGFQGDDNLYGLGIRVGYYTQAISIWVANFYARHEAPYLHTLTIVFLFSLFIGICQLSINPVNTYAVEPFMLTTIAFHTFSLGLSDLQPPYRLRWEFDFRRRCAVLVLFLAFETYNAWYWWTGVWKMKPSNGPLGTVIFYPYVGNTPLFGPDEWISIAARTINAILILALSIGLVILCCSGVQQRRVSHLMSAERLNVLGWQWLKVARHRRMIHDSDETNAGTLDFGDSSQITRNQLSRTDSLTADGESLPAYHQPSRTGTGLLKMGIWRRLSNKDCSPAVSPPDYVTYEPTFGQLNVAYDFLKASTTLPKDRKRWPFKGARFLIMWIYPLWWSMDFLHFVVLQSSHTCRPGILLAIKAHAGALRYGCDMTNAMCFRLAMRDPSYHQVRANDVALASRIILSTEETKKPSRFWRNFIAWGTFGACSVLIIATELTIQWNKIQGVQNLSSVGQLIPFVLGVASLMKIVWSAIGDRNKMPEDFCYYEHCVNKGNREAWREAGRRFLEVRAEMEEYQAACLQEEKAQSDSG